ncbi:MAG: nitroreductase family protein [Deltaproteobacteria bacterium]|nr:MAG: nitroreductase family protein [Deltaproteobacteria bacterium]
MSNEVLKAIYERRSVRDFSPMPVDEQQVMEIIRAGSWAPSGLNNQPWRFVVVKDAKAKEEIAGKTRYGHIIEAAPVIVSVFLDRKAMYHEVKDIQAIGACLQNMLLAAHAQGLGAVWLGEILKNKEKVSEIVSLPSHLELMAVVAIGHPAQRNQTSERKGLDELILKII